MDNNINIEARKLSIIEHLAELQDEVILQQIENILKPKVDIWDELSDERKSILQQGINELNDGKRIEFNQFIAKHRKAK